jgi:hypothetical protein
VQKDFRSSAICPGISSCRTIDIQATLLSDSLSYSLNDTDTYLLPSSLECSNAKSDETKSTSRLCLIGSWMDRGSCALSSAPALADMDLCFMLDFLRLLKILEMSLVGRRAGMALIECMLGYGRITEKLIEARMICVQLDQRVMERIYEELQREPAMNQIAFSSTREAADFFPMRNN